MWQQRLAAGQIWRNGQQLWADVTLAAGDRLVWHRPPWQEPAVPVLPPPLFDDGDLVVFNKPSGLQVLPAGGFLKHTVLGQLARVAPGARPVHRLGRFTSGLLVCARSRQVRAWLSAQLRDSTAAAGAALASATGSGAGPQKVYRALLSPPQQGSALRQLAVGQTLPLDTPIGRRPHGRLGSLWCTAVPRDGAALPARSQLTLIEPRADGWLVQVAIATGRPHQIRIHTAAAGAPLLGDPLYGPGGVARAEALPGDGGYQLHAHRLTIGTLQAGSLELEAPLPPALQACRHLF
jgi:23S rRNA pseudouridine1911/1915/1917 synthase